MIWNRAILPDGFEFNEDRMGGDIFLPGSQPFLKVNRHGERFMNESQEYDNASHASFQQPGHVYAMIHDANFRSDVDRFHTIGCSALTRYIPGMMEGQLEQYEGEGLIMKADTIEELADKMGFTGADKDNFVATVARYNELYDKQNDEDFGKPALGEGGGLRKACKPFERHPHRSLLRLLAGCLSAVQYAGHLHHRELPGQGQQQ